VDVTITLIEDGIHKATPAPTPAASAPAAKAGAKSALDDLDDDLDGLADIPGMTDSLGDEIGSLGDAIDDMVAVLDAVDATMEALASGLDALAEAVESFQTAWDDAYSEVAGLVDFATLDLAYAAVGAVRDAVDALVSGGAVVWQPVTLTTPRGLAEIAMEFLGSADDSALDRLMDANPSVIDLLAVPGGSALWIPVV
jgi:hypothetical protein